MDGAAGAFGRIEGPELLVLRQEVALRRRQNPETEAGLGRPGDHRRPLAASTSFCCCSRADASRSSTCSEMSLTIDDAPISLP